MHTPLAGIFGARPHLRSVPVGIVFSVVTTLYCLHGNIVGAPIGVMNGCHTENFSTTTDLGTPFIPDATLWWWHGAGNCHSRSAARHHWRWLAISHGSIGTTPNTDTNGSTRGNRKGFAQWKVQREPRTHVLGEIGWSCTDLSWWLRGC